MIDIIIGILGMALILLAFIMEDVKKWKHSDLKYATINAIGSVLLIIYAIILKSIPFIILNGVWAFVSIRDFVMDIKKE